MGTKNSTILKFPSLKDLTGFMHAVYLSNWELNVTRLTLTASFSHGEVAFALRCGACVVEEDPAQVLE